ncbi:MAG: LPS-assembly protein LptD [Acidimicrobiia bacterium]|nr:LPS-assembly protein LptD [Acidimicrobiia bacterium]
MCAPFRSLFRSLAWLFLAAAPCAAQTSLGPVVGCGAGPDSEVTTSQWRYETVSATEWRLTGQVEIECENVKFFADEVTLHTDTDRLVARGNVVFTTEGGRISAEEVEFDLRTLTGTFRQAYGIFSLGPQADRTEFGGQDPDVYFYGELMEKLSDTQYRLTKGAFTTCVQPTPRWELSLDSVVINLDEYAVLRNSVLRVKGVPLMYLPYAYYPLKENQRATGFLLPTWGTSTVRGQALSNAFFWAMGRSQDATFFHDWFTKAGQGLGAEYRYLASAGSEGAFRGYLFNQNAAEFQSASGTATALPESRSFELTGTMLHTLGPHMRLRSRLDYFSDLAAQQLYHQDVYSASRRQRLLSGAWSGFWRQYSLTASYQRNEILDARNNSLAYGGTPRATAAVAPVQLFNLPVYGSVQGEFSNDLYTARSTSREDVLGLQRYQVIPGVRVPLSRWAFLSVNSSATWHNTLYSASLDTAGRRSTDPIGRSYLDLSTEVVGPTFTRIWDLGTTEETGRIGGLQRVKHVIEPFASLQRVTGTDTRERIVQTYDVRDYVVQGTTFLTYGLSNRLLVRPRATPDRPSSATVREYFTVTLQQTYYSNTKAGRFDFTYVSADRAARTSQFSPVALTVRTSPWERVSASSRFEYDLEDGTPLSLSLQTSASPSPVFEATISASKTINSRSRTGVVLFDTVASIGTQVRLRAARASYSVMRDLGRRYTVQQSIGVSYNAQCCGFGFDFQEYNYPELSGLVPVSHDRRLNFYFVLAGLGTFQNFFGAFGGPR